MNDRPSRPGWRLMFRVSEHDTTGRRPVPSSRGGRASRRAPVRALAPCCSGHFSDFCKRRAGGGRSSRGRASTCGGSRNAKSSNPNRRREVAVNGAILTATADVLTVAAKVPPSWFSFRLLWFPALRAFRFARFAGSGRSRGAFGPRSDRYRRRESVTHSKARGSGPYRQTQNRC